VTAVWAGNDDNLPIPGTAVTGGTVMAKIWKDYNVAYYQRNPTPPGSFIAPTRQMQGERSADGQQPPGERSESTTNGSDTGEAERPTSDRPAAPPIDSNTPPATKAPTEDEPVPSESPDETESLPTQPTQPVKIPTPSPQPVPTPPRGPSPGPQPMPAPQPAPQVIPQQPAPMPAPSPMVTPH
jgi:membrane peptidoglycan carboxypeptidase